MELSNGFQKTNGNFNFHTPCKRSWDTSMKNVRANHSTACFVSLRSAYKQRPKNHRGNVALPSGKFLHIEGFCAQPLKMHWEGADRLQNFQIVWIFSGWSRKFPDSLESFRIIWIFSGWSGKFSDSLESFRIILIFSGPSGKFSG